MDICEKNKCTGCFACVNICPKNCIEMKDDEIGHIFPHVNEELCSNCGMCIKICPANNSVSKKSVKKVYAGFSKEEQVRKTSASGGIAAVFTKYIIDNGGVVFGAAFDDELNLKHMAVSEQGQAEKLKNSKYTHSKIEDAFKQAKDSLVKGKKVLFVGTPCQIAGLLSFLQTPYENLITCDLVCHGVPSQKLLKEDMKSTLKNDDLSNLNVTFKNSKGLNLTVSKENKILVSKPFYKDLYFLGFQRSLFLRESCYNCDYAKEQRVSDITLGDFHGLGKTTPYEHSTKGGVSLLLVNTEKGQEIINQCESKLVLDERNLDEALCDNPQLRHAPGNIMNRNKFVSIYLNSGFKKACKKSLRKDRIKYSVLYFFQENKLFEKIVLRIKSLRGSKK